MTEAAALEYAPAGQRGGWKWAALALAALLGLWTLTPSKSTFMDFNAPALGRAESDLWRAYYERRYLALGAGLVLADHRAFGFSPWDSLNSGVSAALAARTFQNSRSRAEAQAALPELTRHFAIVARATHSHFDPAQAANLELEWWQVRRETDGIDAYVPVVAAATGDLYGIDPAKLEPYARLRCEAMDLRDARGDKITPRDWAKITALLEQAYAALRAEIAARPASAA